jgi:hypothetical protein
MEIKNTLLTLTDEPSSDISNSKTSRVLIEKRKREANLVEINNLVEIAKANQGQEIARSSMKRALNIASLYKTPKDGELYQPHNQP